jgi:hypothetical protein
VFDGVLAKPIVPADLVRLLATSRPGAQSGPAGPSEPAPG